MYKISGKQQFGAVWDNGVCIATFHQGVAFTNDSTKADILRAKGYIVEGEPDEVAKPEDDTLTNTMDEVGEPEDNTPTDTVDEVGELEDDTPIMGVNLEKPIRKKKGV